MTINSLGISICLAILFSGTVMTRPAPAQQSAMACDAYARNYAQNASRQGKVIGGGVVGGIIGLGIGAATGAAGVGAAIGGGIGAIGGGARRQQDAERMYRAAYQDCMAGRVR